MTKRASLLLKNWEPSQDIKTKAMSYENLGWSVTYSGGKSEALALLALAIIELTFKKPYSSIELLSLREIDYYLRDQSREAVFTNLESAQSKLTQAKALIAQAIFESIQTVNNKSLGIETLSYQIALDIYSYSHDLGDLPLKISDFEHSEEERLIVVNFDDNLDKKSQHIEKLNGHFIELFQDDRFNVIPV